jgi:phage terminase small subunit
MTKKTEAKNEEKRKRGQKAKDAKGKKIVTVRERKVIKSILEGKTPTQAMRDAGYSETTARCKSVKKVEELKPTIEELMEKMGITDERLLDTLNRGLDATKVISANVIARDGEGMADAHSMTKDFVDVEDFAVRHKYMETGLKLKGKLTEKREITGANGAPFAGVIEVRFVKPVDRNT